MTQNRQALERDFRVKLQPRPRETKRQLQRELMQSPPRQYPQPEQELVRCKPLG